MTKRILGLVAFLLSFGAFFAPAAFADDGPPVNPDAMKHYTSVNDMRAYFDQASALVNQFDDANGLPHPQWVFVPSGQYITGSGECQDDGTPSSDAALHCSNNHKVYLGADFMWEQYQYNWAMPLVIMGHEDGHEAQDADGFDHETIHGPPDVLKLENQADCFTGVFAAWAAPQTNANVFADAPGVLDGWEAGGSPDTPRRTHGTGLERKLEFGLGYMSHNLKVCDHVGTTPVS